MSRRVRVHTAAAAEMTEAARWYEACHAGPGGDFLDAIAAALELIGTNPELGMPVFQDARTRRLLLSRFPYKAMAEDPNRTDAATFLHGLGE